MLVAIELVDLVLSDADVSRGKGAGNEGVETHSCSVSSCVGTA